MTYTLADATRDEFERKHPRGKNTLKCTQCHRRKDREDFRETPWHGRAAACQRCEGVTWMVLQYERQRWALEQEREKTRMLRRHIQRLRFRRLLTSVPSSADTLRAVEQPYMDALERAHLRMSAALATLPVPNPERRLKRARLTKENR